MPRFISSDSPAIQSSGSPSAAFSDGRRRESQARRPVCQRAQAGGEAVARLSRRAADARAKCTRSTAALCKPTPAMRRGDGGSRGAKRDGVEIRPLSTPPSPPAADPAPRRSPLLQPLSAPAQRSTREPRPRSQNRGPTELPAPSPAGSGTPPRTHPARSVRFDTESSGGCGIRDRAEQPRHSHACHSLHRNGGATSLFYGHEHRGGDLARTGADWRGKRLRRLRR
jgi:hypothetical protein